jgi:hypothetical protein
MHADDLIVRERQAVETRYFHSRGAAGFPCRSIGWPSPSATVPRTRWRTSMKTRGAGLAGHANGDARAPPAPPDSGEWWSGDLHVHMNYGGLLSQHAGASGHAGPGRRSQSDLQPRRQQGAALPDIASFRPDPDSGVHERLLILHGQEVHTSYWGHLSILNLTQHLLLPGYAAYPFTAAASPYPHNAAIEDMAHRQQALVGYAHPFDEEVDTTRADALISALPVDAALGKIDYYEAVGFADHKATNAMWYRLLECGLQIPAAAGTDAMANYASLRGPVGLNRIYVPATGPLTRDAFPGRGSSRDEAWRPTAR